MDERALGPLDPSHWTAGDAASRARIPRYFDAAARSCDRRGTRIGADPAGDFEQTIAVPPELLESGGGRVTIETSKFFVSGIGGDQRHLALRVYRVSVE